LIDLRKIILLVFAFAEFSNSQGQKWRPLCGPHVSFRQQRTCRYHQGTFEHAKSGFAGSEGPNGRQMKAA
jgi:hypothetical protein